MDRELRQQIAEAQARRAQVAGVTQHIVDGCAVTGVRLTVENLWRVGEWADGKEFYDPAEPGEDHPLLRAGGKMKITGYSVYTPAGKVKAEFGDLVYEEGGRFFVHHGQPVETVAVPL